MRSQAGRRPDSVRCPATDASPASLLGTSVRRRQHPVRAQAPVRSRTSFGRARASRETPSALTPQATRRHTGSRFAQPYLFATQGTFVANRLNRTPHAPDEAPRPVCAARATLGSALGPGENNIFCKQPCTLDFGSFGTLVLAHPTVSAITLANRARASTYSNVRSGAQGSGSDAQVARVGDDPKP